MERLVQEWEWACGHGKRFLDTSKIYTGPLKKDKTGTIVTDDLSIDYEQRKSDKNWFLKNWKVKEKIALWTEEWIYRWKWKNWALLVYVSTTKTDNMSSAQYIWGASIITSACKKPFSLFRTHWGFWIGHKFPLSYQVGTTLVFFRSPLQAVTVTLHLLSAGFCTRWMPEVPSNLNYSMILEWF